jgi:hypothetical protein|tara:strand:- start:1074 stop:1769 length:696 start_codon:yes stop_codon:yes gene_type:complete
MGVLLTLFLIFSGIFFGVIIIPLLSYLVGIKSLGKVTFSLAQFCNGGSCLWYEAQRGYFLLPMRRKGADNWEIFREEKWQPLKNSSVMMLGSRPFGFSYLPSKLAFKNELETRVFSIPTGTEKGEKDSYLLTGDETGDMMGIIPKDVSKEISNESNRTGFVISLRLLISRLSESGGFAVANRSIQNEMTKSALQALSGQSTNTWILISSLVAVIMGAVFGYFIFFHTGAIF